MNNYEPELGQAFFGNPYQQFDVPYSVLGVLEQLADLWYDTLPHHDCPFSNHGPGSNHITDDVKIRAYYWGDDEEIIDQPNLECDIPSGPVRISWYKHCTRGVSSHRELDGRDARDIYDVVSKSILEKPKTLMEELYEVI